MKTNSSSKSRARAGFSDLLAGSIALGSVAFSIMQLQTSVYFAEASYFSKILGPSDMNFATLAARFADQAELMISKGYCRSDMLKIGLNFVLADMDSQNSLTDFDAWARSMDRGDRFLRHALACNPADGNLWTRFAMSHRANGDATEDLAALTEQSVFYAPNEMSSIIARLAIWNKLSSQSLDFVSLSVDHDLRTMLFYAPPGVVKKTLEGLNSDLVARIRPFSNAVSDDRLALLRKERVELPIQP